MIKPSIAPFVPIGKEIAMIKVDVEGREIVVLQNILNLVRDKTFKIHNLLVEFTPKWWDSRDAGKKLIQEFVNDGWEFFSSPWSEHAARVGRAPFGVVPAGTTIDW